MEAGNMGDDRGMTQAQRQEMNSAGVVAVMPAAIGLLVAVVALIRFRHYGPVGRAFALVNVALYGTPLLLFAYTALRR